MKRLTIKAAAFALLLGVTLAGVLSGGQAAAQTGPELTLGIKADRHAVKPGQFITFTFTATNVGDQDAENVVINGWVPDWFNFAASGCTSSDVLVQWNNSTCTVEGALGPGQSVTFTMTLTTFNNPKGDRHAYENGWVTWDPGNVLDSENVKVQIAGKPGK